MFRFVTVSSQLKRTALFSLAFAMLAFLFLSLSKANVSKVQRAPVKWEVTVDFDKTESAGQRPNYVYTAYTIKDHMPTGDAPDCPNGHTSAYCLNMQKGDLLSWTVKTPKSENYSAIYFQQNILYDSSSQQPERYFHGQDNKPTDPPAIIDPSATNSDLEYEYCVAVFDPKKSMVYADDPKIMIGGAGVTPGQLVNEIIDAATHLRELEQKQGNQKAGGIVEKILELAEKLKP